MRRFLFGVPIDECTLSGVVRRFEQGERCLQIFVNIHKVVLFHKRVLDSVLSYRDSVFCVDGKWIEWLARIKGFPAPSRFGGLDAIEKFCALSEEKGARLYFLGATQEILERAVAKLKERFPAMCVAGNHHGFFNDEKSVIAEIRSCSPDVVFLALPSPRKELLALRLLKEAEGIRYACGVGGALDVLAGNAKRAPRCFQRCGLEWFFRSIQNPRLFLRYFSDFFYLLYIMLIPRKKILTEGGSDAREVV